MSNELHQTLRQLHQQLERGEPIDEKSRALLEAAMDEVKQALAKSKPGDGATDASNPETAGLIDRLRVWVERVELEHPALSAGLADLLNTLRKV